MVGDMVVGMAVVVVEVGSGVVDGGYEGLPAKDWQAKQLTIKII